jgi:hypothetical protein
VIGMRKLAILLSFVVAVVGGVAAASAIIPSQGADTLNGPDAVQPDGNGARIAAVTPDPAGHEALAVRIYRSKTGLTCPEAARTDGANFGQLDANDKFQPLDVEAAGSCVDLTQAPMSVITNNYGAVDKRPAYAVVFGAVSSKVATASIRLGDSSRPVDIAGGAYIVATNQAGLADAAVQATLTDGSTRTYPLAATNSPTHDPDPPTGPTGQ